MRLPECIENHGYFWLPGEPANRLPGILRISQVGEATLELFGALGSQSAPAGGEPLLTYPVILGTTTGGGPVTLSHCVVSDRTDAVVSSETISKSSLHVSLVFGRAHFETPDFAFSEMVFSVEGLDEWFYFHHRPFSSAGGPGEPQTLTYAAPDPITFDLAESLAMSFHMGLSENLGMFQHTFTTQMRIHVESSTPLSFSDFMIILRKVKNFLSLAADRPLSFTFIHGYQGGHDEPQRAVEIYGKFDPYDSIEQRSFLGSFLLPYHEHSGEMAGYLRNWLESYEEYEPTFNLYFTVTANRFMHLEGRFLFLAHGIESLHRRSFATTRMSTEEFEHRVDFVLAKVPESWRDWIEARLAHGNEPAFRKRVVEMLEPFKELFGTGSERKNMVDKIVNTRNFLTHYDRELEEIAVTEPQELLSLYWKVESLVQLRLLQLLGLDADQMLAIATRYPPLSERLRLEQ